ncbi:hypothetical protein GCM10011575_08950 [Microlunatus endophyticus]|uniref:Uncharacterized protein n=1 Tax=Microlunatus endophyticus TaxID=1716077 RepID=A0A917S2B7_9ACTN|nr:hypothetical protein [Microlunatus endophyticus]GGL52777.1 hypothetical protein GCM10011575_08950 [Microlunatus endophyticus]
MSQKEQAETSLREVRELTLRTRLASRTNATGFPMVGWGITWIFGVTAAGPASFEHGVLFLGGLAMCLYAIATKDIVYAVVSGFGIVMAGVQAALGTTTPPLWFGVTAGVPLLALGLQRVFRGGGHV